MSQKVVCSGARHLKQKRRCATVRQKRLGQINDVANMSSDAKCDCKTYSFKDIQTRLTLVDAFPLSLNECAAEHQKVLHTDSTSAIRVEQCQSCFP